MSDDVNLQPDDETTDLVIPKPGVSRRSLSIALAIDRLPPGDYHIELEKPDIKTLSWDVTITRRERTQKLRLTYKPE